LSPVWQCYHERDVTTNRFTSGLDGTRNVDDGWPADGAPGGWLGGNPAKLHVHAAVDQLHQERSIAG
jgi:hypothetical protein